MREALPRAETVLRRREHGAQVQHETVGILVRALAGFAHCMVHQVERVAADHRQVAGRPHIEHAVCPGDPHRQLAAAYVVDTEVVVEQADEGADGGRCVVVLGLAQQQCAAALEVAQIDVVAEGTAARFAAAVDRQHDFGLGVVPGAFRVQANLCAHADRTQGLRLGEDLGVGADANLKVLRPHALADQHLAQLCGLRRAGLDAAQVVADHGDHRTPHRLCATGIAARLLLDDTLQHRGHERHAGRLDRLQVAGRQQPGRQRVLLSGAGVGKQRGGSGNRWAAELAHGADRVGHLQQLRAGRGYGRDVVDVVGAHAHQARAEAFGPDATDQQCLFMVLRQHDFGT